MLSRAGAPDVTTRLAVENPRCLDIRDEVVAVMTAGRSEKRHPADVLVKPPRDVPAKRLSRGDQRLVRGVDVPTSRAQRALDVVVLPKQTSTGMIEQRSNGEDVVAHCDA